MSVSQRPDRGAIYRRFWLIVCQFLFALTSAQALGGRQCRDLLTTQNEIAQSILETNGPPSGRLVPLAATPQSYGSQGGRFYRDSKGQVWFLKQDLRHPELQTGAEVISSWIYRHFGYPAPETYIVNLKGVRFSASRFLPEGQDTSLRSEMPDTPKFRGLRVVAAFLKDWDRLHSHNNRLYSDGSISFHDFGGTLGARAKGEIKPGAAFSHAIGSFSAPNPFESDGKTSKLPRGRKGEDRNPMVELFDSYQVHSLPENHPWRKLTVEDAKAVLESFRTLDSDLIIEIVERAQFSSWRDTHQMVKSLVARRNAFLENLLRHLGEPRPEQESYWARQSSQMALSYEVRNNRPRRIGEDVKKFVESLNVPQGFMILFRGQSEKTEKVLSPLARENFARNGRLMSSAEQERYFSEVLQQAKNELNDKRERAYQYRTFVPNTKTIRWWDRATPYDYLADSHSKSEGHEFFVSATRSLGVASRWVEGGRFPTTYRYVYILLVPESQTLPISASIQHLHGSLNEAEIAVLYDATPYVLRIYDTKKFEWSYP